MVACTKRQVIDHIHRLLVIQLKRTEPVQRRCVLRDDKIRLIAHRSVRPTDLVIADDTENKDFLPLRTVIHHGVNENWNALNAIDIII